MDQKTTLVAFFTKSPMKLRSLSSQADWVDKVRETMKTPTASVIMVEQAEWDAPTLMAVTPAEIRGKFDQITNAMKKYLIDHGVPKNSANSVTGNFEVLPIPATMRAVLIVTYTGQIINRPTERS